MTQFATETTKDLLAMLTYGRPHKSDAEAAFVQRFVNTLPGIHYDKFGNGMVRIGTAPILFSCHTDTVHHASGRQKIAIKEGIAHLKNPVRGLCLGADDAAGVWLMREMIAANVSGLYVFHAGEEFGGLGSAYIAKEHGLLLRDYKAAIAFDRKGTTSVITHQMTRTCSDTFGQSLCRLLGPTWELDDTGTFTDTANYTDLIGECSNISVGYEGAHGPTETLDIWFLQNLRNELVRFDYDKLVFERQPGDIDDDDVIYYTKKSSVSYATTFAKEIELPDEALIELCRDYPEVAAQLIERMGLNVADMVEACEDEGFDLGARYER